MRTALGWDRYNEDGVVRPLKAKSLGGICRHCFAREILDRGSFPLGHTFLRTWTLMDREGIPD